MRSYYEAALTVQGVGADELPGAVERVVHNLCTMLSDERGRWVLQAREGHRCEYALSAVSALGVQRVVIDRTFIDDGRRWIIDYKTGSHEGAGIEAFLDNEQVRYRDQLERYARLMSKSESMPISLALYFPAVAGWRAWEWQDDGGEM